MDCDDYTIGTIHELQEHDIRKQHSPDNFQEPVEKIMFAEVTGL